MSLDYFGAFMALELPPGTVDQLLEGRNGPWFAASGLTFLIGEILFGLSAIRARVFSWIASVLFMGGMIPVALDLSGSRRYRVKSPLGELLKGSLATYVNAFAFPDKTGYVFGSQNTRDMYNLADVFLDAVFCPLLPAGDFHAFAGVLQRVSERGSEVVMGSHEAISAANAARDNRLEVTEVL